MKNKKQEILDLSVQNNKKSIKDILSPIEQLIVILTFVLTTIVTSYKFILYLYDIQMFNYWNIDSSFYKNNPNAINNLLYIIIVICWFILIAFSIKNNTNKEINFKNLINKVKYFLGYLTSYFLLSLEYFYKYGLNLINLISQILAAIIIYFVIKHWVKKFNDFTSIQNIKSDYSLKDILLFPFILIISLCIIALIMGNINVHSIKNYRIIKDDNSCNVILYSCDEYYVVADCKIDGETLSVYKNTNRKIDNYEVMSGWQQFDKIVKIEKTDSTK